MDPWDWNALLDARKSDSIQQWADMESKSPTMRDEIYQRQMPEEAPRTNALALLAVAAKLLTALVQAWLTRSR